MAVRTFDDVEEMEKAGQVVRSAVHVCGLAELPKVLRTIRQTRGVTQEDLAAGAGVHVGTIVRLEQGKDQGFKTETVEKVLAALNVSLELLLRDRAGSPGPGTSQT